MPDSARGYVSTNGSVLNLKPGSLIDGSSKFVFTGLVEPLRTGDLATFGFRLLNEGDLGTATDDTVHYGWARVILTPSGPGITDGILVDYAFEATPLAPISTPVPEPAAALLMCTGVIGVLTRSLRRRYA